MSSNNRNGLTLVSVIVVIILLMLLAAVLLPAIQQARETTRQSDCKSRLFQIVFAMKNYHENYNAFPPGWVPVSGEDEQSAYGWNTFLLPFLDHTLLFQSINFRAVDPSFQSEGPRTASNGYSFASTQLKSLLRCGSDTGASLDTSSTVPLIATSNYVGNFGVGIPRRGYDQRFMQGVFGKNSCIRIRDMRDGTTNVVMVGERILPRSGQTWAEGQIDGAFNSYWSGFPRGTNPLAIVATVTDGDLPDADSDEANSRHKNFVDDDLNRVGSLRRIDGHHQFRTIRLNQGIAGQSLTDAIHLGKETSAGYSSRHPGGAHVVFADGSVRFVNDTVGVESWIDWMRRADGAPCRFE